MTNAQIAGRVAGIAYVYTRRTVALIDWAEVAAIVLHGLQVLIALTVLAGQMTRRAWDALPALSEQLGQWYATALTDGCTGLRMVYSSLTGAPVTPTHRENHVAFPRCQRTDRHLQAEWPIR